MFPFFYLSLLFLSSLLICNDDIFSYTLGYTGEAREASTRGRRPASVFQFRVRMYKTRHLSTTPYAANGKVWVYSILLLKYIYIVLEFLMPHNGSTRLNYIYCNYKFFISMNYKNYLSIA